MDNKLVKLALNVGIIVLKPDGKTKMVVKGKDLQYGKNNNILAFKYQKELWCVEVKAYKKTWWLNINK